MEDAPCTSKGRKVRKAKADTTAPPGRLARDWNTPYGVQEAMEAYKRVAAAHVSCYAITASCHRYDRLHVWCKHTR